ncbi:hypothetical protein CDD83_857 [Cordyceps sp. RAO-2017]|nr:hypothetical protein CDD83_857 [Cordyceps sp. RAO-2017]
MPDGNSGKQGKLSRFLSGSRKQGRAATVVSHHEVPDSVPAIPINLEEKLYGRLDQPPSVPKKDAPWARVEQQPLQTIISTESLDLVDHDSRAQSSPQVLLQARQPQPPASAPATSTSSHERKPSSGSLSDAPIKRKPVGSAPRHASGNEGWHQAFPGNGFPDVVEEEDDEKYGSGMTSTPATGASEAPRARNMRAKSKPSTPTRLTRARTLDSRSSAPNLAASFETLPRPPLPQADAQDGISPWPLEMRTRALKTARDMLPSQTSSVTAEPVSSLSRSNSRERLHSYHWLPSQTKNAEAAVVGAPPPPMRHSYSAHGRHPPVVYRRAHGRQDNDEQGHQYRILHSYNSPAYKHVPIWS